jgi:hypothetical protein
MFFGVPLFAIAYSAISFVVEHFLAKKSLPVDSFAYRSDEVDCSGESGDPIDPL